MILTLLQKDWLRIVRNPIPWLLLLLLPLVVTFIMGAAFGGNSSESRPSLKIIVVDMDGEFAGEFLKNISRSQSDGGNRIIIDFADTIDSGSERFLKNRHSAMLILPEGFSQSLIEEDQIKPIRLIKNPAQSIMPHVAEDLVLTGMRFLEILRAPFKNDFSSIIDAVDNSKSLDSITLARLMLTLGNKMESFENIFFQPLIESGQSNGFLQPENSNDDDGEEMTSNSPEKKTNRSANVFAIVLPMMASFFLFFGGDSASRDIYRELETRNLARFMSRFSSILPLIISKAAFSFSFMFLSAVILYVSGWYIFETRWEDPVAALALNASYSLFVAGMGFVLIALFRTEKRVQLWANFIIFFIAFAGGSIFTVSALPDWVQNHISPLLPNYWYVSAIHSSQLGRGDYLWTQAVIQLLVTASVLLILATIRIQSLIRNQKFG